MGWKVSISLFELEYFGLMHVVIILIASASVRFYVLVHIIEIVVELLHPVWFFCGCEHQLVPVVPVVKVFFPLFSSFRLFKAVWWTPVLVIPEVTSICGLFLLLCSLEQGMGKDNAIIYVIFAKACSIHPRISLSSLKSKPVLAHHPCPTPPACSQASPAVTVKEIWRQHSKIRETQTSISSFSFGPLQLKRRQF